jgi:hypothetical protein
MRFFVQQQYTVAWDSFDVSGVSLETRLWRRRSYRSAEAALAAVEVAKRQFRLSSFRVVMTDDKVVDFTVKQVDLVDDNAMSKIRPQRYESRCVLIPVVQREG